MAKREAKVWTMATKFHGAPKPSDFKIVTQPLAELQDGEFLVEADTWSVDPYNRAFAGTLPAGSPMIGFQVGTVTESRNAQYPVGAHVVGHFGWRTLTLVNLKTQPEQAAYLLPKSIEGLPLSYSVGVLGMPGITAYFGLLDKCEAKAGETVVVNAASGAVGLVVGQLAKIKGCRVIGFAGTDEKVALCKEYGFDAVYNYKKTDLAASLKEGAPKGVDCFFDNVGGTFATTVYEQMNKFGRICQCGNINAYNNTEKAMIPDYLGIFIGKELTLRGILIFSFFPQFPKAIDELANYVKEGKIKYKEQVYQGFNEMPRACIEQLEGKNFGKSVVKK